MSGCAPRPGSRTFFTEPHVGRESIDSGSGLAFRESKRCKIVAETERDANMGRWAFKSSTNTRKIDPISALECLGHLVSADCSVQLDWQRTRQKMLASFWVNVAHRSLKGAPLGMKLKQLDRCVRPIFDFRCTRLTQLTGLLPASCVKRTHSNES